MELYNIFKVVEKRNLSLESYTSRGIVNPGVKLSIVSVPPGRIVRTPNELGINTLSETLSVAYNPSTETINFP